MLAVSRGCGKLFFPLWGLEYLDVGRFCVQDSHLKVVGVRLRELRGLNFWFVGDADSSFFVFSE